MSEVHVIAGPAPCKSCGEPVIWARLEGPIDKDKLKTGALPRWRDPQTWHIHRCAKEGDIE